MLPAVSGLNEVHWPVPCIRGGTTSRDLSSLLRRYLLRRLLNGVDRPVFSCRSSQRAEVEVLLPPDNSLGHPGGPAGIEHIEVVARSHWQAAAVTARYRQLVFVGASGTRSAVLKNEAPPHHLRPMAAFLDQAAEGSLVDDCHELSILCHVFEFWRHIAIIQIDRHGPRLEATNHHLKEFDAGYEIGHLQSHQGLPPTP